MNRGEKWTTSEFLNILERRTYRYSGSRAMWAPAKPWPKAQKAKRTRRQIRAGKGKKVAA